MSEKSILPLRFLFCLITISMFLLIISSSFLLQFSSTSFIPRSIFKLILLNGTSVLLKTTVDNDPIKHPFITSMHSQTDTETSMRNGETTYQSTNSGMKMTDSFGRQKRKKCEPSQALLRVYMYDLPPEFHFGLLGWKGKPNQTWPDVSKPSRIRPYPGGLNLQHSIEYWLTLDLLSSNTENIYRPCTAIRVMNSSQADVIFVPFFSSLSYNRYSKPHGKEKISVNKMLQRKLVQFLMNQDEWKRLSGKDHLIVAHHPNSMLDARRHLGSAMFVLADFGRYPVEVANVEKDIIAPYMHLVRTVPGGESAPFDQRPTLAYFQGAIYRKDGGIIRQELYYLLRDEKDVHFTFGSIRGDGVKNAGRGMSSSKFCLNIAGDTPSSNRLFDAIASHCVPVIISDKIELPYKDVLEYPEFCITVNSMDAVKKGFLLNLLRGIKQEQWTKMWKRLKEVVRHFEYQYPSQPGDAVDMIWEAVSCKLPLVRFKVCRRNSYLGSQHPVNSNLNEDLSL